jgi:predicted GNAT family acetyltransferase
MHVLDNPVWHALTGPHATVAERAPRAARYRTDVSVFGAIPDDPTPDAWNDLAALVGPGGATSIVRRDLTMPATWSTVFTLPCRQMVLPAEVACAAPDARVSILELGAVDVPEMLALVERTKPGPLLARTVELGTYLGVRENGVLVAMAGVRMRPTGYREISAVCTEPSHQGRGLASQLVRAVVARIRDRNEVPILHLTLANESAHRVYRGLGFETRMLFDVSGVKAPL